MNHLSKSVGVKLVERSLFNIRWTLVLFYLGLVVVLGMYAATFVADLLHVASAFTGHTMDQMKIIALDFIDVVMIANLIEMIVTGSYNSFVSKDHGYANKNISSGTLKQKITTSIMVVMMIHFLRTFTEYEVNYDRLVQMLCIFGAILLGGLVLAVMDYLHIKGDVLEHSSESKEH